MKIIFLSVLLIAVTSAFGEVKPITTNFEKLSFIISASNYNKLVETEKLKILQQLVVSFKSFDNELYNDLYQGIHSLKSINDNTLKFLTVTKCPQVSRKPGIESEFSLNEYRCKNLIPNALKKYDSLESELDLYVLPLISEFETEIMKVYRPNGMSEVISSLKEVINDLRSRVSRLKMVKKYYYANDFKSADKEINNILLLLGAQNENVHYTHFNSRNN